MMGMGEKSRNAIKRKKRKPRKNFSFGCPPIPPSTKWRPTVFRCLKTPKTSRTYPRWERDPNLMGQKRQRWVRYGQLMTDDMNYMHVKFQDFQQKRAGVRVEAQKIMEMGKILETSHKMTGTMTHNVLLTSLQGGRKLFLLTRCVVSKDPYRRRWAGRGRKDDSNIAPFLTTRLAAFTHLLSNVMRS